MALAGEAPRLATRSRLVVPVLGLVSLALAVAAIWLALHNPEVRTDQGNVYSCSAPYDTVLFDADNVPGGEPPVDGYEAADLCRDAGQLRFAGSVGLGLGAVLLAALTSGGAIRSRSRRPRPPVSA